MASKSIRFLRGRSENGLVRLYIERGYPLYNNNSDVLNFRIYRKKEDGFLQGSDYYEYFDALNFKDADIIYTGPLTKQDRYYFVYTDSDVKLLDVYAYWVAYDNDSVPAGPLGIAVRDPEVWWTYERINQEMNRLYNIYSGEKKFKTFGYSTRKKEIKGLVIGNQEKCIGLIGVVHAGESGPELFLKAAAHIAINYPEVLSKVGLAILPDVNTDCREDMATGTPQYLRCNPNGVDLNRNFDANWEIIDYTYGLNTSILGSITYRGPFVESEEETKATVNFINTVKPKVIFCGHCLSSICSDCFLTAKEAKGNVEYEKKCMELITPYSNGFRDTEKEGVALHYGTTCGSIPAFAYKKYGIPAFDMEFRVVKDDKRERECISGKTTKDLLDEYIGYHTAGIINVMKSMV